MEIDRGPGRWRPAEALRDRGPEPNDNGAIKFRSGEIVWPEA